VISVDDLKVVVANVVVVRSGKGPAYSGPIC